MKSKSSHDTAGKSAPVKRGAIIRAFPAHESVIDERVRHHYRALQTPGSRREVAANLRRWARQLEKSAQLLEVRSN